MAVDSTPGFSQVDNFDNVGFNQGIASIGGQHTVSFYGKSKDGTVYVLTKDGTYSITQTKLTEKQYSNALETILSANKNGYTPSQQHERNTELEKQDKQQNLGVKF